MCQARWLETRAAYLSYSKASVANDTAEVPISKWSFAGKEKTRREAGFFRIRRSYLDASGCF
jgi:hypothetical protein